MRSGCSGSARCGRRSGRRAGVHRCQELEPGGKQGLASGARDRHATGLERFTQGFQDVAVELRQLVQKQHPVVCQRDFARARQHCLRRPMQAPTRCVGRTKRPLAPSRGLEPATRHRVDRSHFERLSLRERRQDAGKTCREHGFSGTRGPTIKTLWPPAAATSSARFTCCCPLTSLKSG